jgi:hypothetical protein
MEEGLSEFQPLLKPGKIMFIFEILQEERVKEGDSFRVLGK